MYDPFEMPPWKEHDHRCSPMAGDGPPCDRCKRYYKDRERVRAVVKQGVRAARLHKRVHTDGDMSCVLDAWERGDLSHAFEVADRSDGRITVETSEQLGAGIIAALWTVENEPSIQPTARTPGVVAYRSDKQVRRFLGSSEARFRGMIHDDIDVDIDDIKIEHAGYTREISLHGSRGEQILVLSFDDPKYVQRGDTFSCCRRETGDRVVPVFTRGGRPAGRVFNEHSVGLAVLKAESKVVPRWQASTCEVCNGAGLTTIGTSCSACRGMGMVAADDRPSWMNHRMNDTAENQRD